MIILARGRREREGNSARQIEYSYHIEVRTLNARRMFRTQKALTLLKTIQTVAAPEAHD